MLKEWFRADITEEAALIIIEILVDNSHKSIYYDGWNGLGASAVIRQIAQHPPRSLLAKFNKIIHIDCSRWKSRRALQREITQQLKLPQFVMDILDREDKEDDFCGVDEGSRNEIEDVGAEINRALLPHTCLVVFHNGSDQTIDLNDFGVPRPMDKWSASRSKLLWTFRGRFRFKEELSENVDHSHLFLRIQYSSFKVKKQIKYLVQKEAIETTRHTNRDMLDEVAFKCCLYLLLLNFKVCHTTNNNCLVHASNYLVCDGIVQGGLDNNDEAWELAAALHQQMHIEDFSCRTLPSWFDELKTPEQWIFSSDNSAIKEMIVPPGTTSFFLAAHPSLATLPSDMFHQSDKLGVLKLSNCTFSFSSPPFHCCHGLRFLGLDSCHNEEDDKQDRPTMEFLETLWVLDIHNTDFELALSPDMTKRMASNIREVHIKKGRFWKSNFAWRQLHNLRKVRVMEPTCPWETGEMDEFAEMVKLELLELSANSTILVLPSLSGATSLKTLVLDACVGLKQIGPQGLPPSLESFRLDACTQISHISLAGCARLVNFILRGSLPKLEELNLSGTSVKTLNLKYQVVQVPSLQRVILLGCEQLCAVLWPEEEGQLQLSMLCIDTRGGAQVDRILDDFNKPVECQMYVGIMYMRFIQSLPLKSLWNTKRCYLNLCISCNSTDVGESYKEIIEPPMSKSLTLTPQGTYNDVATEKITIDNDYGSAKSFRLLDSYLATVTTSIIKVEIGEGISNTIVERERGIQAIDYVMDKAMSLHVHDNIATLWPESMNIGWSCLKWCCVERCPKLHTVFPNNYYSNCFGELENFWAAHLQMAHCIWKKVPYSSMSSLRSIHIYNCPRLTFVLSLSNCSNLISLETLHIINCGDLKQVFPMEQEFLSETMKFPSLKYIYLYELYKLQHICEAKMFALAPKLETVKLRGCWALRRLPFVSRRDTIPIPMVDCEKDCWEKLEWDGLEAGHHPTLFKTRHSAYYKKPLPRFSYLR